MFIATNNTCSSGADDMIYVCLTGFPMRIFNQSMGSNGKVNGKLLLMKQPMLMGTFRAKCSFFPEVDWKLIH